MIRIAILNDTVISKGIRSIKAAVRSRRDVRTAYSAAPWGDDSVPPKGTKMVHAETVADEEVVLGAINRDCKAAPGEKRLYATDADGNTVGHIWLKADGTIEFLGTGDNLVKYAPLAQATTGYNQDINAELLKIQTAITALGGAYTYTPLTLDLSGAKIDNLKTP